MGEAKTVLFVCTGNAGRSQMAEELFRVGAPADVEVLSAGVAPWGNVHPVAAAFLEGRGLDIRRKTPRHVRDFAGRRLSVVVTIGGAARDQTPAFPGPPVRMHWDIDDPAAADGRPDSEVVFRQTLAAIEGRLKPLRELVAALGVEEPYAPRISTCFVRPARFEPARHLPLVAAAGFQSIELNCFMGVRDFAWRSASALRELTVVSKSEGVRIGSAHAPRCPWEGLTRDVANEYVETTKRFCDIAAELGARVVVVHAPMPPKPIPDEGGLVHDALDAWAQYALPLPLIVGVENLDWRVDVQRDMDLIRSHPSGALGFVLDNGHSHIPGKTDDYLALCGHTLCGLHIQDNDGTADAHALPGEGTVDWPQFMANLAHAGYGGPLTLEVQDARRQSDLPSYLSAARSAVHMLQSHLPR